MNGLKESLAYLSGLAYLKNSRLNLSIILNFQLITRNENIKVHLFCYCVSSGEVLYFLEYLNIMKL